MLFFITYYFYC